MIFQLNVHDYTGEGLVLEWEDNMSIKAEIDSANNVLGISGNREGLISLARFLLTLAQPSVPSGYHIHLDEMTFLEKGSCEVIIAKL